MTEKKIPISKLKSSIDESEKALFLAKINAEINAELLKNGKQTIRRFEKFIQEIKSQTGIK